MSGAIPISGMKLRGAVSGLERPCPAPRAPHAFLVARGTAPGGLARHARDRLPGPPRADAVRTSHAHSTSPHPYRQVPAYAPGSRTASVSEFGPHAHAFLTHGRR